MIISPSLLTCDFANIANELSTINNADLIHIDVMDGHFVPNISIGVPVVKSIKKVTDIPLDVHLMISEPGKYIPQFIDAGADIIGFHIEAKGNTGENIEKIISLGAKPMLTISPDTPAERVFPYLDMLDTVLIMTVYPGFGGQKLIPDCLKKALKIKEEIIRRGLSVKIEADGGINEENIYEVKNHGVDIAVIGNAVFSQKDRKAFIEKIKKI